MIECKVCQTYNWKFYVVLSIAYAIRWSDNLFGDIIVENSLQIMNIKYLFEKMLEYQHM